MSEVKDPETGENIVLSGHKLDRQKIRYLYVTRPHKDSRHILIGIVTEDFMYFEIVKNFTYFSKRRSLKTYPSRAAKALAYAAALKSFYLAPSSHVGYNHETIDFKDPVLMYLNAIRMHVFYSVQRVNSKRLLTVINSNYRSNYVLQKRTKTRESKMVWSPHITSESLESIWNTFLENGRCPWINYDVDKMIMSQYKPGIIAVRHNGGKRMVRARKLLRLAMLYMVLVDRDRIYWKKTPSGKSILQKVNERNKIRKQKTKESLLATQNVYNRPMTQEETENEAE